MIKSVFFLILIFMYICLCLILYLYLILFPIINILRISARSLKMSAVNALNDLSVSIKNIIEIFSECLDTDTPK